MHFVNPREIKDFSRFCCWKDGFWIKVALKIITDVNNAFTLLHTIIPNKPHRGRSNLHEQVKECIKRATVPLVRFPETSLCRDWINFCTPCLQRLVQPSILRSRLLQKGWVSSSTKTLLSDNFRMWSLMWRVSFKGVCRVILAGGVMNRGASFLQEMDLFDVKNRTVF